MFDTLKKGGTVVKAKDYLKQLQKLDRLIENKLAEKEQWKAMATNTTQQMTADRVQASSNPQKMADAVYKIIEIEAEIDAYILKVLCQKVDGIFLTPIAIFCW